MKQGPLSIAVLTASLSWRGGGASYAVCRGAIALSGLDCQVTVYGLEDDYDGEDLPAWQLFQPKAFPVQGPAILGYAPDLLPTLLAGGHDLLHLHGLWQYPSAAALRWRKRTGKSVVVSPHGMLDPWALQNAAWKKRLARFLFEDRNLSGASCLHALNESEAQSMRALGLTNPIAVIPNGVDMPESGYRSERPGWLPADGRRTLCFIGRLHAKKGVAELLTAWALLKREAPKIALNWRLVVAGWDDGGHRAVLERRISEAGLGDDVVMPGPVYGDAKAALLTAADAFVLPSHSEGMPMAILEAWAYGLPVLMTRACNLSEGFETGAALEIETEPQTLACQLRAGLSNSDLATLGMRGKELVAERFTWAKIAKEHLVVYRWLMSDTTRPACVRMM